MKDKTPKIIAVDFDGTLCTNAYPEIGLRAGSRSPIHYYMLRARRRRVILSRCTLADKANSLTTRSLGVKPAE